MSFSILIKPVPDYYPLLDPCMVYKSLLQNILQSDLFQPKKKKSYWFYVHDCYLHKGVQPMLVCLEIMGSSIKFWQQYVCSFVLPHLQNCECHFRLAIVTLEHSLTDEQVDIQMLCSHMIPIFAQEMIIFTSSCNIYRVQLCFFSSS